MLKIRLMRIGGKQRPFYRVVAVDERAKRTGAYVELLGTYNPLTEPKEIKLKQDRIDYWVKQGAQMSDGFLRIIGKAKQRPPRKAKKEKAESVKGEKPTEEAPKEEKPAEEQPAQTPTAEETPVEAQPEQTTTENPTNEKEEVVDDSAVQTESKEIAESESVQNKTDERPA